MNKEELKQKKLAFLDETIKFYNSHNRAIEENCFGYCIYSPTKTSPGCAIGRHIPDKGLCARLDILDTETGVQSNVVFQQLPPALQELGQDFLVKIQQLHDNNENWDKNGLSGMGKIKAKDIKDWIEIGLI